MENKINNIKILFIGLGGIGQRHLKNVYSKFGHKVTIIAYRIQGYRYTILPDLTIDKDIDFIKKYSIKTFTDIDQALGKSPDVAFICNPTNAHIPSCIKVAKAGCDFFVEKPLSNTLDNIDELLSIYQSKKLISQIGFQLRFHPCYRLLKKLIFQELIGNIISVHAEIGEFLPDWHKYEDYRKMYASRNDLGGGVILSQTHEIDYLYDLFGMPNRVMAIGGHLSNLEIDVEDIADILLEFNYKGKCLPISLHMDYIQRPPSRGCKIIGENGKITMDLIESKVILEMNKDKKIFDFSNLKRNELFVDEIDHFFESVFTRRQPVVTLKDGINSLKIALAIKESMTTKEIIKLEK